MNLPDTRLSLPSLTEEDRANLPFIVQHADIVGYSFVRTVADESIANLTKTTRQTRKSGWF
ncbi:MAG: pyruvate kinase [Saprospiraceae bacterium]